MSATRTAPHKGKGRNKASNARDRKAAKRSPVLPIALGLFVLLAIVAVVVSRGGGDDGSTAGDDGASAIEQTRPVQVTGTSLADFEAGNDTAVGTTAPVLQGQTFDGASITIGKAGDPQVVFFVAHWCPHCQKEVPVISEWIADKGIPQGVSLYGVSTGVNKSAPNYPPSRWLDREDWPVRTLADDERGTAAKAYGLTGYPFFVAIDGDGEVVARASGELSVEQIEALVDAARR
ncbi:MAG TPA: TlpA disulfide reductase family protein [Acidimicrobiales bacterium]|jgi:cytochrome c biogenesis protein CcmG, thiol:disulfide interchange protein DsbE|nr:TlpA disulfide reductase family protein [Acidimicrobiales bacterium]